MAAYRAIVFDLDGTLTPVRSVWRHLHEALGLWEGAAMAHQRAFEAGEIGYREWCALDAAHWRGRRVAELAGIADAIPYRAGARESVAALRARGALVALVTTGLDLLADRVRDDLRLDYAICNGLESEAGVLTGRVQINVEHDGKDEALERFCGLFRLSPDQVVAVGDSEGDIPMFRMAGFSVAVSPATRKAADAASVVVPGESLAGLLAILPAVGAAEGRGPRNETWRSPG